MPKEITSSEYINSFQFDHVDTYSFQRGSKYEALLNSPLPEEWKKLHERKIGGDILSDEELRRFIQLLPPSEEPVLINSKGEFHSTSVKINSFKRTEPQAHTLIEILNTEIKSVVIYRCPPKYRDGLVFYDKNAQIVSVLNVCFECTALLGTPGRITADAAVYKLLRQFFTDCGHKIEPNRH